MTGRLLPAIACALGCALTVPAAGWAHWTPPRSPDGSEPVALVLRGDQLSRAELRAGAAVLTYQFNHQVRRFWGGPPIEIHVLRGRAPTTWPLLKLLPTGRPHGTGGFHDIGVAGRPVAGVYLRWWGDNWTVGASHELLEMLEDPYGDTITADYLEEPCDPVAFVWYLLHGSYVSDFVTPAWFTGAPGPWDFAGRLRAPRAFARGGEEDHFSNGHWGWIGPGAHMRKLPKPLKLRRP